MTGWLKVYPWVLALLEKRRLQAVLIRIALLGFTGMVASQFGTRSFDAWLGGLQQHQRVVGHAGVMP